MGEEPCQRHPCYERTEPCEVRHLEPLKRLANKTYILNEAKGEGVNTTDGVSNKEKPKQWHVSSFFPPPPGTTSWFSSSHLQGSLQPQLGGFLRRGGTPELWCLARAGQRVELCVSYWSCGHLHSVQLSWKALAVPRRRPWQVVRCLIGYSWHVLQLGFFNSKFFEEYA